MATSRVRVFASALTVCLLWTHRLFPRASATIVDEMQQGFLFDWAGDESTPIPTAAQCDTLHITWGRRSALGQNPVAPYFLQIYTSAFIVPFVIPAGSGSTFDWPVPFVPGTQFQICMFASNGVTGGCQQIYTVYPASGNSTPTCQNLTYPAAALDVTAKTQDGSWSQYGWMNQCSDISITPNNGTPPYTYTIAPALRPPFNFTANSKDTQDWTVTLAFGLPFWLSVVDSTGFTWTNGPLHAGPGSASCLLVGPSQDDAAVLSLAGTIGVSVGALFLGLAVGTLGAYVFFHKREQRYDPVSRKSSEPPDQSTQDPNSPTSNAFLRNRGYDIEPFVLPPITQESPNSATGLFPRQTSYLATSSTGSDRNPPSSPLHESSLGHLGASQSPTATVNSGARSPPAVGGAGGPSASAHSHVYVVHHDAGRPPPVTVFTSDGTEVVELPPQYESAAAAESSSARPPPPEGQQRRQPRALGAKPGGGKATAGDRPSSARS